METIKVYGFTKTAKKELLYVGIDMFKGTTYYNRSEVKKTKQKMDSIVFPCFMLVTENLDINHKSILQDLNGNLWSISHFITDPKP